MENLNELINASTIPSFSTNISLSMRSESGRINIPIIDEDAKVDFYIVYKKQDRQKLKKLIKIIENQRNI